LIAHNNDGAAMTSIFVPAKLMQGIRARLHSLLAGASVIGLSIASTPVAAQSLEEAMASAYAVNPGLKAERSRYEATNQGIWTARSEFLPTVTGT
jgi:outer membrane protein